MKKEVPKDFKISSNNMRYGRPVNTENDLANNDYNTQPTNINIQKRTVAFDDQKFASISGEFNVAHGEELTNRKMETFATVQNDLRQSINQTAHISRRSMLISAQAKKESFKK